MQNLKWLKRNSVIAVLSFAAMIALFVFLGFWQLDRGAMKQSLFESYQQKNAMLPISLDEITTGDISIQDLVWRRVIIQGKFSSPRVYLLENQMQNGQPGYHVLSPFFINGSGQTVLVNRGWVASGPYRDRIPYIETPQDGMTLQGVVYLPQENAFSKGDTVEVFDNNVVRLQEVNLNTLADESTGRLLPYLINLDPSSPGGYAHVWREPGFGKERHLGYAFQWFSLALVLVIIYFARSIKRSRADA
jgi:surfeit locus 1 family protein